VLDPFHEGRFLWPKVASHFHATSVRLGHI
jgi:hypothetical protein